MKKIKYYLSDIQIYKGPFNFFDLGFKLYQASLIIPVCIYVNKICKNLLNY